MIATMFVFVTTYCCDVTYAAHDRFGSATSVRSFDSMRLCVLLWTVGVATTVFCDTCRQIYSVCATVRCVHTVLVIGSVQGC